MADDFKKSALGLFKKATEVAAETATSLKSEYEKSELKKNVDETLKETKEYLDEKGVTDKASEISDYTSEQLDKVSGKKILELVEERLSLQEDYNNILAVKLEEVLKRVKTLEDKLSEK